MVALHNRKLQYSDVFPDNPWTWKQRNDQQQSFQDARTAVGESELSAMMGAMEDTRKFYAAQPRMGDMQRAFKRIYPPKPVTSALDDLKAALEAIRDGHNDPRALAAEVLKKLETSK